MIIKLYTKTSSVIIVLQLKFSDRRRHVKIWTLCWCYFIIIIIIITAIEFSLGGSSPYTSTDKTSKNNFMFSPCIFKSVTFIFRLMHLIV